MRRVVALTWLALLAACTTVDDLAPVASRTETSVVGTATTYPRFGDNDPHDWDGRTPWTLCRPRHRRVEIPDLDRLGEAKASGISFAFIKATEGGDRVDDYFAEHWHGTRAAGVPRGAYHFYYFCRPAAEQAAWFIRNVPRERPRCRRCSTWSGIRTRRPASCARRPRRCAARCGHFLEIVEKHYGKKPIIYTSIDFFDDNDLSTFQRLSLLAALGRRPSAGKYGSHPFTFWQYTGTGVVPGIRGDADINVFNGSHGAWKKWLKATRTERRRKS